MTAGRGALIVLEGLDRSGKSTQSARLVQRIENEGRPCTLLKFPDRTTTIGKMIDSYLRSASDLDDRVIHLLFSANRWEASEAIKRDLLAGTTIVVDRYVYSGVAFSAAKGLDYMWCRNPEIGLPRPDAVIFLSLSNEEAARRGGFGEERYEKEEMQGKVREMFTRLMEDPKDAGDWRVADASGDVEQVSDRIWNVVEPVLTSVGNNEIRSIFSENFEDFVHDLRKMMLDSGEKLRVRERLCYKK